MRHVQKMDQVENVEPGGVLGLRPGQVASRPGRVLGSAIPPNPTKIMENESQ